MDNSESDSSSDGDSPEDNMHKMGPVRSATVRLIQDENGQMHHMLVASHYDDGGANAFVSIYQEHQLICVHSYLDGYVVKKVIFDEKYIYLVD